MILFLWSITLPLKMNTNYENDLVEEMNVIAINDIINNDIAINEIINNDIAINDAAAADLIQNDVVDLIHDDAAAADLIQNDVVDLIQNDASIETINSELDMYAEQYETILNENYKLEQTIIICSEQHKNMTEKLNSIMNYLKLATEKMKLVKEQNEQIKNENKKLKEQL